MSAKIKILTETTKRKMGSANHSESTHTFNDRRPSRGQGGHDPVVVHHVEERDAPEVDAEVTPDAHRPVLAPEPPKPFTALLGLIGKFFPQPAFPAGVSQRLR